MTTRIGFVFLNIGHFHTHMFMLLYPTVVLALEQALDRPYPALIVLSTAGFVAFGAGALPAGWLGDRWSRTGMMTVMFFGLALGGLITGLAQGPLGIAVGLTVIGAAAAIYHPVGIAMVVEGAGGRLGRRLGLNGVFGNLGVALAGLIAGTLADAFGWRWAFFGPHWRRRRPGLPMHGWRTRTS